MNKAKYIFIAVAAVFTVALVSVVAVASTSLPSSKAAVALGDLEFIPASIPGSGETDWTTVMQTFIKTPNMKDLSADVSLQCGLITDTTVRSKGGTLDGAAANGTIRVRVIATNTETNEERYFEPSEGGDTELGVTYCDRLQQLEAKFAGLNCTADLATGVVTCTNEEELRLLLETLNANAFNFLLADVTPGVWQIEVQAKGEANVILSGTALGSGTATAFVGLGSTRIETLRLIKDAYLGPIVELVD